MDGILEAADHPVTFFIALTFLVAPILIATILVLQWVGVLGRVDGIGG